MKSAPLAETVTAGVPVFSERLTDVLDAIFDGQAPNRGRFCGYCFTPIGEERERCLHCENHVSEIAPVQSVPDEILAMYKQLRRRESLVVNGFAYAGLILGVAVFIAVFYVLFIMGADVWWYVADIVLVFVLARVLAGLLGGYIGDEVGYNYARRKLAEDWAAYDAEHFTGKPQTSNG